MTKKRRYKLSLSVNQVIELIEKQYIIVPYSKGMEIDLSINYDGIEDVEKLGLELVRLGMEMDDEARMVKGENDE